jgi:hypothetical protein
MNNKIGISLLLFSFFTQMVFAQKIGISEKDIVMRIASTPEHPRNSEGDFVTLDDGRILFVYKQFESVTSDHAPAK